MKVTLIALGILLAVILGFLYAGIIGAILFSLSIVLSLYLTALEKPSVKATGLRFLLFLCLGYGLMYFFWSAGCRRAGEAKTTLGAGGIDKKQAQSALGHYFAEAK